MLGLKISQSTYFFLKNAPVRTLVAKTIQLNKAIQSSRTWQVKGSDINLYPAIYLFYFATNNAQSVVGSAMYDLCVFDSISVKTLSKDKVSACD